MTWRQTLHDTEAPSSALPKNSASSLTRDFGSIGGFAADGRFVDFDERRFRIEVPAYRFELGHTQGTGAETVLAHNLAGVRGGVVNVAHKSVGGLNLEPLNAVRPKRLRVGREQQESAQPSHSERLLENGSWISPKGTDPVLNAHHRVESAVTETQCARICQRQAVVRPRAEWYD